MYALFFVKRILNFYDLRTFDAKFCCENLRTFSADYFGLKSKIRRHFYFLDVCIRAFSIDHDDTLLAAECWYHLSSLLLISKRLVLVGVVKQGISMSGSTRVRMYASKRMTSQKYNARRNAHRLPLYGSMRCIYCIDYFRQLS